MKTWQIAVALVALEVVLVVLFVSDANNWDCGGQCSTYAMVLGRLTAFVVPGCLVLLLLGTAVARVRRRRRHVDA